MPKIIANLEENMLQISRKTLLEQGYRQLTIRGVARDCGVAVGTVYNYYESKEMLVATVILQDWKVAVERIRLRAESCTDLLEGLSAIRDEIAAFADIYRDFWQQYDGHAREQLLNRWHPTMVEKLGAELVPMLQRLGAPQIPAMEDFLATILLAAAGRQECFDHMRPVLSHLLRP